MLNIKNILIAAGIAFFAGLCMGAYGMHKGEQAGLVSALVNSQKTAARDIASAVKISQIVDASTEANDLRVAVIQAKAVSVIATKEKQYVTPNSQGHLPTIGTVCALDPDTVGMLNSARSESSGSASVSDAEGKAVAEASHAVGWVASGI